MLVDVPGTELAGQRRQLVKVAIAVKTRLISFHYLSVVDFSNITVCPDLFRLLQFC